MLIPISNKNSIIECRYINVDNEGFWLIAPNKKLLGEAQMLETHKSNLRELELNSTWLVLEIVENHLDYLKVEILDKNPRDLSKEELESLPENETGFRIECELYVRELIQNFRLEHPLIKKYKQRVGDLYIANRIFPYQVSMVLACLANRHVPEDAVIIDKSDAEKGTVKLSDVRNGKITIGLAGLSEDDLKYLSEDLTLQLYSFANTQHNNLAWNTTKDLEKMKPVSQAEEKTEVEEDEPKKAVESK